MHLLSDIPLSISLTLPCPDVSLPLDVDECVVGGVCGTHAVCVNTVGSYTCPCVSGYADGGGECVGE